MVRNVFVALVLGSVAPGRGNAAEPGVVKSEFVFEKAPFKQCHASTIAMGRDGLVVAWFGGTREKNPDVSIWVSRQEDGKWTAPVEVAQGFAPDASGRQTLFATWNPVLFQRPGGDLVLFYKVGLNPREWWGAYRTSSDGGRTWSGSIRLPDGFAGPVKNKPLLLEDGTLLCGSSTEDKGWRVHFESTRDFASWQSTGAVNDGVAVSAIQPSILRLADGGLMALGRSKQKQLWSAISRDAGSSWEPMRLMDMPNPNSGTDAVTLKSGVHVLVYNHTARGRSPLNVATSLNGLNWNAAAVLESAPGEYSYPAVIQTDDGRVHITYTWRRERIKHVVLDAARLPSRPILQGRWPSDF